MDTKNHLGELLRRRALAEESLYFARAALTRTETAAPPRPDGASPAEGRCPRCRRHLRPDRIGALKTHRCDQCGGLWLDRVGLHPFPLQAQGEWIAQIEHYYTRRPGH